MSAPDHADILRLLSTLELQGVFGDDIALEGGYLDALRDRAALLASEALPQSANELLADWERVYGLTPAVTDTLQARRNSLIAKIRATGGLSVPYFTSLALALGMVVDIQEKVDGNPNVWRIALPATSDYLFRAGESYAGDRLLYWGTNAGIEGVFDDLKPAHTRVIYAYA